MEPSGATLVIGGGGTPGGRGMMHVMQQLQEAGSLDLVKWLDCLWEIILHRHSGQPAPLSVAPGVVLRNGHTYRFRSQLCQEVGCVKRGFSLRNWQQRAVSRGWHPPMSNSRWGEGSAEPYSSHRDESDFGAPF